METTKKIFITGTNRGLGKELVKLLIAQHPQTQIHISATISPDELAQQWTKEIGKHSLHCYQIDLSSPQSTTLAIKSIQDKHIIFDTIVANVTAGSDYGTVIPTVEVASRTLLTNVTATINFIKQFLPFLSSNGRVVIVSSIMGLLKIQSEPVQKLLTNPKITEEQILEIVQQYIDCAAKKEMGQFHWSAYATSKCILNAWVRFILPTYIKEGQSIVCLQPGCKADMEGEQASLTAQQGATRINEAIWLKEIQKDKFYNNQKFCDYFTCQ